MDGPHFAPEGDQGKAPAGWNPAGASEDGQASNGTGAKFTPRKLPEGQERRALRALMRGPVTREGLDRAAPASNGPAVVARLRARGVEISCEMREGTNRHGEPCRYGVYHLLPGQVELVGDLLGVRHG